MNLDNLLRINKLITIISRGRSLELRNKRRRQSYYKEITRRDLLGFEYLRALFSRVITNAQRFTRSLIEFLIEPFIESFIEPLIESLIEPFIESSIIAEGVAQ